MNAIVVRVDASGRLVIPKEMRDELGLADGGVLTLSVEDGELRATSRLAAIRRLQRKLAGRVPPGHSVVDELIADRRRQAALEEDAAMGATTGIPQGR